MLNFKSYNRRELQQFLSILDQCETKGIKDIRLVRGQIYNYVHKGSLSKRVSGITKKKVQNILKKDPKDVFKPCPSCGKSILRSVKVEEDMKIMGCSKCRYSEIMED